MAASTSAGAFPISPRPSPPRKLIAPTMFPTSRPRQRFISMIRSSGDDDFTSPTATTTTDVGIESPEATPSLINSINVERAMRGLPITDLDYYGLLGLTMSVRSEEVISGAYKTKVEDVLSQELDEEEVSKKLQDLKEAFLVLSSAQERRLYDWSLKRADNTEVYSWPFEVDNTITSQGDPPPQEPEDFGPTRLVGYGFLAWVIFSFASSIFLSLQ
uniref:Chaperone DnaJ-domain superfamily protein n=1 Tax=Geranium phaeum TaxID=379952 RepID=A0A0F7H002_9ROSI